MGSCPDTDIDSTFAGYDLFPLFTCFFFSLISLLFFSWCLEVISNGHYIN